ncbi:uncharacterized protein LOC124258432 [Haliotis rubra]|uniref:uncharacterized protein LOC124258432 n=1 Tax=Haliotis rubra TaxID=36100 RepID=UPI001EE5AA62|nr:uncharacterized protein LOC124258432 [Haliotis rubra]
MVELNDLLKGMSDLHLKDYLNFNKCEEEICAKDKSRKVFLGRTLKATSIPNYVNVVRLMHVEVGLPNPTDNWEYKLLLRGVNRLKGVPPKQKLPITVHILQEIRNRIDTSVAFYKAFWAACVIAFFGFLRKSTLLPRKESDTPSHCLLMCDASLSDDKKSATIVIRHTKTIQFGQRVLRLPLHWIPGSPLCPVKALDNLLQLFPPSISQQGIPPFSYLDNHRNIKCLTYNTFVSTLKKILTVCGYKADDFSGHSFRRGGCTFAFKAGLSAPFVKLRGDWRSNAYERYITLDDELHERVSQVLSLYVLSS